MANTSATVLISVFGIENGKTASMEFSNPKATVTQAQVHDLMQSIIIKNVVDTKNGELTSIIDGSIVEMTFTDLVP